MLLPSHSEGALLWVLIPSLLFLIYIFIFPHLTALRLAELNTFHQMQNLKRDLDSSQLGSRDCYRNASYNHAYLPLDSAWFQNMPDMGKFASIIFTICY